MASTRPPAQWRSMRTSPSWGNISRQMLAMLAITGKSTLSDIRGRSGTSVPLTTSPREVWWKYARLSMSAIAGFMKVLQCHRFDAHPESVQRHIRQRCDIAVVGAGAGNDAFRFDPTLPNQHGGHPRGSSHDPRDFCAISHLDLIAMAESEESLHYGMVRRHPLRVWCCTALTRDLLIAGRSSSISRRDSHRALHPEALLNLQPSRSIASLSPARRCKR